MRLEGKVAIITGGGSGIGQAAARLFAQNGVKVVVADFDPAAGKETAQAIKNASGETSFLQVDISDPAQVDRMVQDTLETYKRIDILCNAAAIFMFGTALDTDKKAWNKVMSTVLDGTFLCCRAVLPHMIKQGGGSIINICSTAGAHDAVGNAVAYVTAKGGVALLSKALALDHGRDNVRVNVIIPGPTDTPMLRKNWTAHEIAASAATLPLGRVGRPEELAQAMLFLASDAASFITGVMLPVDGGQSAGGLSRKLS